MTHSSNRAIRPLGIFANSVLTSRASVKALTSESNLTRVAIAATVLNKGSGPFSFPEKITIYSNSERSEFFLKLNTF